MEPDNKDRKILPLLPVLCTDSNQRSHKERLLESWSQTCDDKSFSTMLNIINNRVVELRSRGIVLLNKTKNKIYSKIKKRNCSAHFIKLQKDINPNYEC